MTTDISELTQAGRELEKISVILSYDIIRLFSEGLYQSPHKAIEELVSNSYDAGAMNVHVLLPDQNDEDIIPAPLWVIDDGHGMNATEFHHLWRVARSTKTNAHPCKGRLPIGQFGIGKLAAYVLAWHLIHVSRVENRFLLTVMDFRIVEGLRASNPDPVKISLREIDGQTARSFLADIKKRDPHAWQLLFGTDNLESSWTVAGLSDFRGLYDKLSVGRLQWVLSTGLPLHSNFKIYLNGKQIESSKLKQDPLKDIPIDEELPLIGTVTGNARIYPNSLTAGKSVRVGRSHGFFIRVRERVINLEDELFGVTQPNHAAWSRFAMEIHAEGLQKHLLSSREGVRDSEAVREFRQYLRRIFNQCRSAYDDWNRMQVEEVDIQTLLTDTPSNHILEPLLSGIQFTLESGEDSFYISATKDNSDQDATERLASLREKIAHQPFKATTFVQHGPHAAAVRYTPSTCSLAVNIEHPFVNKLTNDDRNRNPAKLFAPSEVLLEGLLGGYGIRGSVIADILHARDRALRRMAGEALPTASETLRILRVANQNEHALERATGAAFRVLGFEYERRGGNVPGPDGVLFARLGRHGDKDHNYMDYKLVYDAKHTDSPTVQADKIDPSSLEDFRSQESAAYGFFVAVKYANEDKPDGKINRKLFPEQSPQNYEHLTLLKIDHLEHLIQLHFHHGLTLADIGGMFKECRTVIQVDEWISKMQRKLSESEVPLAILIGILESLKEDEKAVPNVKAARMVNDELKKFSPNRLIARLKAVEMIVGDRWLEVEDSGDVKMNQTGRQILGQLNRQIGTLDM